MTQEESIKLQELHNLFLKDCERVADILGEYDVFTEYYDNIHFADTFNICDGDVSWEGDEYWAFQGHEHHSGFFPLGYLVMSEEELRAEASKLNDEYLDKKRKQEDEKEKRQKEMEYQDYLKLKEQFEK